MGNETNYRGHTIHRVGDTYLVAYPVTGVFATPEFPDARMARRFVDVLCARSREGRMSSPGRYAGKKAA